MIKYHMIKLSDLINACDDIKNDIGVDKNDKPIVGKGFNYGVIDTCNRIVKHFNELKTDIDDLPFKPHPVPNTEGK